MEHKDYKDIYIGQLIQKKVDESQMSYTEFARQIHVARTSLYRIFESKSIDVERLLLISEVLDYDFIHKVYIGGEEEATTGTHLSLPIHKGHVYIDDLPPAIINWLREALDKSH